MNSLRRVHNLAKRAKSCNSIWLKQVALSNELHSNQAIPALCNHHQLIRNHNSHINRVSIAFLIQAIFIIQDIEALMKISSNLKATWKAPSNQTHLLAEQLPQEKENILLMKKKKKNKASTLTSLILRSLTPMTTVMNKLTGKRVCGCSWLNRI